MSQVKAAMEPVEFMTIPPLLHSQIPFTLATLWKANGLGVISAWCQCHNKILMSGDVVWAYTSYKHLVVLISANTFVIYYFVMTYNIIM